MTNEVFARCPVCDGQEVRRLADDWNKDAIAIPIVDGCGNPWHYVFPVETSLRAEPPPDLSDSLE